MSWHCAERCGVLRLVDERFDGVARGVGSRRIAGRIHLLPLKIENLYLSMSVLVLAPEDKLVKTSHIQESPAVADEGRPAALRTRNVDERSTSSADMDVQIDFLLGLDSLRRYQCCVDLARNVLVIPLSTAEGGGGGERGGGAADSTEIVGKSGDPRVRWSSSGVRAPPPECDHPPALLLVPFLN
jgi:DNA damage-inducible protein 1